MLAYIADDNDKDSDFGLVSMSRRSFSNKSKRSLALKGESSRSYVLEVT